MNAYEQKEARWLNRQREAHPISKSQRIEFDAAKLNADQVVGDCHFVMPGWVAKGSYNGDATLFVWCEEHFCWTSHGSSGLNVEFRSAHCGEHGRQAAGILVRGDAPSELRKILAGYVRSKKSTHTPPPWPLPRVVEMSCDPVVKGQCFKLDRDFATGRATAVVEFDCPNCGKRHTCRESYLSTPANFRVVGYRLECGYVRVVMPWAEGELNSASE